jgi:hypothetical protein
MHNRRQAQRSLRKKSPTAFRGALSVHSRKPVLRASAGNTDVHPHAAFRSAPLAWGYENASPPGLFNGELKMENGEFDWRQPTFNF